MTRDIEVQTDLTAFDVFGDSDIDEDDEEELPKQGNLKAF